MGAKRPDQAEINAWKKKHKAIYCLEVGDGFFCYLKHPSRHNIARAETAMISKGGNSIKAVEILLADCWLTGDEEIKTDDSLFMSARDSILPLLEREAGELKKL